jgi:hypothetical protein
METGCTAARRAEEGVVAVVMRMPLLMVLVAPDPFLRSFVCRRLQALALAADPKFRVSPEEEGGTLLSSKIRHRWPCKED